MGKDSKHYLPNGKEYKGSVHKTGTKVMTGATHTAKSQTLSHKPKIKTK
jgi:hypothetical protein